MLLAPGVYLDTATEMWIVRKATVANDAGCTGVIAVVRRRRGRKAAIVHDWAKEYKKGTEGVLDTCVVDQKRRYGAGVSLR